MWLCNHVYTLFQTKAKTNFSLSFQQEEVIRHTLCQMTLIHVTQASEVGGVYVALTSLSYTVYILYIVHILYIVD